MNQIIRVSGLSESRWLNGLGRKADIASGDGWLLGFAWLDGDAPFSDYKGSDRTITLVEGRGFALDLPEGSTLTVARLFEPAAFDGAGPIPCRLLGGPCRVLNAVSAYPGYAHTVQVVSGADLAEIEPGPSVFAIVLRGTVSGAMPLDAIRLHEPVTAGADVLIAVARFEKQGD